MALQWQEVGSLKGAQGPKGDPGPTGKTGSGIRTANTTITASSDVLLDVITPSAGIQVGDMLLDNTGALYTIESISEGVSVRVGTALAPNLKGPQGEKGDPGEKGADGNGISLKGSYANLEALQSAVPTGEPGDAYILTDNGHIAVWDSTDSQWKDAGQFQGPAGEKGDPGDPGTAATIQVGTVQTGEPGSDAVVTNGGTENAAVLNITLPRGEQGPKGDTGTMGITFGTGVPSEPSAVGAGYIDIETLSLYVYKEAE